MSLPAHTRLTARTLMEQTGWKRPMPQSICQDSEVLLRITEYSYDIQNQGFIRYLADRTGILLDPKHPEVQRRQKAGSLKTPPAPLSLHQQIALMSDAEYLTTDLLVRKYDPSGKEKPQAEWVVIPREERNLRSHRIFKGRLQDCWELYTQHNPTPAQPVGQLKLI